MPARRVGRAIAAVTLAAAAGACAPPREPPMHVQVPRAQLASDPDAITVSWIGHATLLVGIRGHWFLTDPMFSERLAGVLPRAVGPALGPTRRCWCRRAS